MAKQSIENLFNFEKKIVLVTGSSGQLGLEFIKLYLDLGCKVYGIDLKRIQFKHKNFKFFKSNIVKQDQIKKIINAIILKEKKIDIIINNAAVSYFSKINNRKKFEIDNTVDVNLKGVINIISEYFKFHSKKKLKKCKIINIASIYGLVSPDFRIYGKKDRFSSEIYGATKAGVIQLTKYFSVFLSKHNITVNCISPGGVINNKKQRKNFQINYKNRVPLARMAYPEDLFTSILFLTSDSTSYVTGQNIIVDGGLSSL